MHHGYQGELRIEAPDYIGTAPEIVAAAGELGYPNVDMNGAPYTEGSHDLLHIQYCESETHTHRLKQIL